MDPNEALKNLRESIQKAREAQDSEDGQEAFEDAASDAVDAAEALDGWISSGGFLPDDWKPRGAA